MNESINPLRRRVLKGITAGSLAAVGAGLPFGQTASAASGSRTSVIVIGAGMAGLGAAKKLAEAGLAVTVLEAKAVVGGRVYTERSVDNIPMDLGAGWIHGPDPANPITGLAAQANAATYQTDDDSVRVFDGGGQDVTTTQFGSANTAYRTLMASARSYAAAQTADLSLADAIKAVDATALNNPFNLYPLTSTTEFDKGGWLEAFSAKNFSDDEKFPGKDVLFPNGYDVIPKLLARNLDIRLNQPVTAINYGGSTATVTTTTASYTADYVICTAPLGVLKAGSIAFSPALPQAKADAIARLGMGQINKLFMVFDSAFWPTDIQYFGYHSPVRGRYAYFLNYRTFAPGVNCLVTFGFGEQGKVLETMSQSDLIADVTRALTTVFGSSAVAPRKIFLTRWNGDPYARGAYSFAAVNSGYADHVTLAQPANQLLFAGEHTHEMYRATTHGAYLSGLREANRIIAVRGGSASQGDVDRLMNWAESAYPTLFAPRGVRSAQLSIYNYRYYPATNSYLGVDNNNTVVYLSPSGQLLSVGPLSQFLPQATAAGF